MARSEAPTDDAGIFRREALEHRARQKGPGDVVRIAPGWASWAFYLLLVLFVAGLVAGSVIEIDRSARGPTAVDDEGRVLVLLPASLAPNVAVGRPVELESGSVEVVEFDGRILYPPDAARLYGAEIFFPSVVVVTSATDAAAAGGTGRVVIDTEPLLVALVPGLKPLLGED